MADRGTDERDLRRDEEIEIANEFAAVHICKVYTRNGERLEIQARRKDRLIRLDPLELETLACHDDESMIDIDIGIPMPSSGSSAADRKVEPE